MNLIDATFPYPVLNPNTDDVSFSVCSYTPDVRVSTDGRSFSLDFVIDIDDDYILDLIEKEMAVYSMEVTCRGTYMMQRDAGKSNHLHLDLPEGSVKGNVEISLTITAVNRIEDYCNPRAHEDYENQSFVIEPGEVIAFFGTEILPTDIKYPKLGSASSFIEVRPLETEGKYTHIDLDSNIIGICMPKEQYDQYGFLRNSEELAGVFHSSMVTNALVFALLRYSEYKSKDFTWVKTLDYYFDNVPELKSLIDPIKGYDDEGREITISSHPNLCQQIAQMILGYPYAVLISNLKEKEDKKLQSDDSE